MTDKIFVKKNEIQLKGLISWRDASYRSILAMCTGSGKSRCGVLAAQRVVEEMIDPYYTPKILIIVPTETLRDEGWKDEFVKWKQKDIYEKNVVRSCYVSANKINNEEFDLVIMDECHRITPANSEFFTQNKVKRILGLTATPPEDQDKKDLLRALGLKISFKYSLEEGVLDGVVAPFDINVVELRLDETNTYLVEPKKAPAYKTSEKARYRALTAIIEKMQWSGKDVPAFMYLNRMRFLYDLPSKTKAAKEILKKHFGAKERHLIFAGSIKQAEELCPYRYHSKTDDKDLQRLKQGKIHKLSCIKALNEGENIPNMDSAMVVQLSSKSLDLIQRIGRVVRVREGHRATIWILCVVDTQDEKWVKKALEGFDPSVIKYHHIKNL